MIGINVWVYLALWHIPYATVLTPGNKVVLYRITVRNFCTLCVMSLKILSSTSIKQTSLIIIIISHNFTAPNMLTVNNIINRMTLEIESNICTINLSSISYLLAPSVAMRILIWLDLNLESDDKRNRWGIMECRTAQGNPSFSNIIPRICAYLKHKVGPCIMIPSN